MQEAFTEVYPKKTEIKGPKYITGIPKVEKAIAEMKKITPPVVFDVSLIRHLTEEDASQMKEKIKACDIYMPERSGWDEGELLALNLCSEGILYPEEMKREKPFLKGEAKALFESKKPVVLVDLPKTEDQPNTEPDIRHYRHLPFSEALRLFKEEVEIDGEYMSEREEYMLEQMPKKIRQALVDNPELKAKDKIKVFMPLGSEHTRISHALRKIDPGSTRDNAVRTFLHIQELTKNSMFGLKLDDDLAAKAMLEYIFFPYLQKRAETGDLGSLFASIREASSRFSTEEIKEVFCIWSKNKDPEATRTALGQKFKEKKIALPLEKITVPPEEEVDIC